MPWECLNCGYLNKDGYTRYECEKCLLDKETAVTMQIKLRHNCEECGHRHKYGQYCHVYVDAENTFIEVLAIKMHSAPYRILYFYFALLYLSLFTARLGE